MPITLPRILHVDDDEDARQIVSALLKVSQIEAKAVATAAQALSSLQSEHFDLYLLDSGLPDLDGFELCRRIRDFKPDTPILFFSGAAYDSDRRRGFEAGANDYVTKPDVDSLLGRIRQLVFKKVIAVNSCETPGSGGAKWGSAPTQKTDNSTLSNPALFPVAMVVTTTLPEPPDTTSTLDQSWWRSTRATTG